MPHINLDEVPAWLTKLNGKFREAAIRGLHSAALRTVAHITTELIPKQDRPPVDEDAYRAGWRVRKLPNGAVVENTVPYASIIEHGARAENIKISRPMIKALTKWVLRHNMASDDIGARNVAWAIAVSMKKRGIFGPKGLRILEQAKKSIPKFIDEECRREVARVKG